MCDASWPIRLTKPGGGVRVIQTTVRQRLRNQLHRGDRCAQLVRHVTDKVAANSLEVVHARLVTHHQQGRNLAAERDRAGVEVAIVQRDRALLDVAALTRGIEQADEPVVHLGGDEIRALDEWKTEQAARGLVGQEHPALSIEFDDAGIKEKPHRPQHVDAPGNRKYLSVESGATG